MKVTGIIAECNPFHKGHAYLLEKAREQTGADYLIVVISGNFVQRGEPAVYDKSVRARQILEHGADLVLELPLYCAASGADYFARGAVTLLNGLDVVTDLCFGSESGDIGKIMQIGQFFLSESGEFRSLIKKLLQSGRSYPAARAEAARRVGVEIPASPNDLLASEYCKSLLSLQSPITPHAIPRISSDSATVLRQEILRRRLPDDPAVSFDDFSFPLQYTLSGKSASEFSGYLDVSPDLAGRIVKKLPRFNSCHDFCLQLKSRNYTYTTISRALLHILLNMKQSSMNRYDAAGLIGYVRILGMRKSAAPLLHAISGNSRLPLITRPAKAKAVLTPVFEKMFEEDVLASDLYTQTARLRRILARKEYLRLQELRKIKKAGADSSSGLPSGFSETEEPAPGEYARRLIVI